MSRKHDNWKYRKKRFKRSRKAGWGMNLYRDKEEGIVAGVCAGLAKHFDFAPWVVRLIFIGGFLMMGGLMVVAYIAGWILMAPRQKDSVEAYEYDDRRHGYERKHMFKYAGSPSIRLQRAQERLNRATHRVEGMEAYVTSRQYELNRKFADLDK